MEINPENYGIKGKKSDLIGGDAKENAKITLSIFDGEKSPRRDVVVLNAAAALLIDDKVGDLKTGIEMAEYLIDSKKAKEKLEEIIKVSELF
jgi:anthranilate phosphoribosyltransferase